MSTLFHAFQDLLTFGTIVIIAMIAGGILVVLAMIADSVWLFRAARLAEGEHSSSLFEAIRHRRHNENQDQLKKTA